MMKSQHHHALELRLTCPRLITARGAEARGLLVLVPRSSRHSSTTGSSLCCGAASFARCCGSGTIPSRPWKSLNVSAKSPSSSRIGLRGPDEACSNGFTAIDEA